MSRLVLTVTALILALAGARAAMCDAKDGWQNFELEDASGHRVPKDVMARAVLFRSVSRATLKLNKNKKLPADCSLSSIDVSKDCLKYHTVKNVGQYAVFDSLETVTFGCPNGDTVSFRVHTRTKVDHHGKVQGYAWTARPIST